MSWIERRLPHFGVKPRRVCYLTIFCVLKLLLLSQLVSSSFQSQLPDALFLLYSPGGGRFHRKALHSACCSPPSGTVLPRAARRVRSRGEQSCCGRQWLKWPRAAPSPSSSCHRTSLCFLVFHCLSCTAKPLCSPLQLLALHPAGCSHSTAGCIVPPAGSAASKHPLQLCVTVRYGNYVNAPACVQCKPEL